MMEAENRLCLLVFVGVCVCVGFNLVLRKRVSIGCVAFTLHTGYDYNIYMFVVYNYYSSLKARERGRERHRLTFTHTRGVEGRGSLDGNLLSLWWRLVHTIYLLRVFFKIFTSKNALNCVTCTIA